MSDVFCLVVVLLISFDVLVQLVLLEDWRWVTSQSGCYGGCFWTIGTNQRKFALDSFHHHSRQKTDWVEENKSSTSVTAAVKKLQKWLMIFIHHARTVMMKDDHGEIKWIAYRKFGGKCRPVTNNCWLIRDPKCIPTTYTCNCNRYFFYTSKRSR